MTVDLAASAVAYQQKVWNTGTLSDGAHTVKISWDSGERRRQVHQRRRGRGDRHPDHGPSDLHDARHAPTPPTAAAAPATTRYEQKDTHFTFAGGWIASSSISASGGSFRFADSAGSAATATFNGTFLAWIGKKSPVYGKAKVTVDGGHPADRGPLQRRHEVAAEALGHRDARRRRAHGQDRMDRDQERQRPPAPTSTSTPSTSRGRSARRPPSPATRWEQNDSSLRLRRHLDHLVVILGVGRQLPLRRTPPDPR